MLFIAMSRVSEPQNQHNIVICSVYKSYTITHIFSSPAIFRPLPGYFQIVFLDRYQVTESPDTGISSCRYKDLQLYRVTMIRTFRRVYALLVGFLGIYSIRYQAIFGLSLASFRCIWVIFSLNPLFLEQYPGFIFRLITEKPHFQHGLVRFSSYTE